MRYLSDFLFSPERANSPVRTLSGGERNRVLLARLFALPANVLVLDEPTNDLDIETLDLLEDLLQDYAGTVFLVSHDRRFLDEVVTSTIAWEGEATPGLWREYEGGYEDWRIQRERSRALQAAAAPAPRAEASPAPPRAASASPAGGPAHRGRRRTHWPARTAPALPPAAASPWAWRPAAHHCAPGPGTAGHGRSRRAARTAPLRRPACAPARTARRWP